MTKRKSTAPAARQGPIRRIIVAIDASPQSLAALDAAVELASSWHAEVLGLFVEDADLLRWAALPFGRMVSSVTATAAAPDETEVQEQLRIRSQRAKHALESTVERLGVRGSFRIVRGTVHRELLGAVSETDLLTVARGAPVGAGLGSTTRAIISNATGKVLILGKHAPLLGTVVAVYDSKAGPAVLEAGLDLVRQRQRDFVVLVVSGRANKSADLGSEVSQWLRSREAEARVVHLREQDILDVSRIGQAVGARILVLPGGNMWSPQLLEQIAREFSGHVMIVPGKGS